jgi:hypothetical protein
MQQNLGRCNTSSRVNVSQFWHCRPPIARTQSQVKSVIHRQPDRVHIQFYAQVESNISKASMIEHPALGAGTGGWRHLSSPVEMTW